MLAVEALVGIFLSLKKSSTYESEELTFFGQLNVMLSVELGHLLPLFSKNRGLANHSDVWMGLAHQLSALVEEVYICRQGLSNRQFPRNIQIYLILGCKSFILANFRPFDPVSYWRLLCLDTRVLSFFRFFCQEFLRVVHKVKTLA